jgi:hypothetical protein
MTASDARVWPERMATSPAVRNNSESAPSPADESGRRLAHRLVSHLRRDELQHAAEIVVNAIRLDPSRVGIASIKGAFSRADRLDLLLDLFLSEDAQAGLSVALVAEACVLGSTLNRTAEVESWLEARQRGALAWTNYDYLRSLVPRSHPLVPRLRALKYPDFPDIQSSGDLVTYAEKIADRIVISQQALDKLYSCSRFSTLPRDVWERRVRVSFCIDHITTDVYLDWYDLFDQDVSQAALSRLDASKGNLLITTHGGFISIAASWLRRAVPDRLVLVNKNRTGLTNRLKISANEDVRAALFTLHRALQDKQTVLMAPDSQVGSLQSSITVLGSERRLADGAAFLACETGCSTAWYTVVREGSRFTPVIVAAPTREPGEKYQHFKGRLYGFYAEQIESMMTGDPDNIVFKQGWMREIEALRVPQDGVLRLT